MSGPFIRTKKGESSGKREPGPWEAARRGAGGLPGAVCQSSPQTRPPGPRRHRSPPGLVEDRPAPRPGPAKPGVHELNTLELSPLKAMRPCANPNR